MYGPNSGSSRKLRTLPNWHGPS